MQDAGNFNYNRMITEGMDHIGKVDSLKGEQVFIKVNDKPVDGRIYTFISSSELQSKSLPEQLKFVKVPDAVMKDMLKNASANYKQFSRTAKTGTVIIDKHEVALENDQIINAKRSAEEFKAIKNRISQSRGKFTSFKSAISIFTRLKSKMTYNKLSAERENRSLLDPILTKTEEKIQEKLNAKLNTQKKIADFPEKMNLKPRVFSKQELGRPPKHREELKKKICQ